MLYNQIMIEVKIKELSPLKLAFIGDAVHTLFARKQLLFKNLSNIANLSKNCTRFCNAHAQEIAYFKMLKLVNVEEKDIAFRARNANIKHSAKNFSIETYRHATAFEAVIGFLYLTNQFDRLNLFLTLSLEVDL